MRRRIGGLSRRKNIEGNPLVVKWSNPLVIYRMTFALATDPDKPDRQPIYEAHFPPLPLRIPFNVKQMYRCASPAGSGLSLKRERRRDPFDASPVERENRRPVFCLPFRQPLHFARCFYRIVVKSTFPNQEERCLHFPFLPQFLSFRTP